LNLKTSIAAIGVAALVAFLVWGLVNAGDGGIATGEPVPTKTLPTLPPGGEGSLADYRGRWVLLNVWASWCIPCREESPALDRFEAGNRDRIAVLGIDTRDLTDDALAFMEEYDIAYDQLRDASGEYADDLETTGVPESFLVDPDGNLVAHFPGPFRDLVEIEEFAAPAIGKTEPAPGEDGSTGEAGSGGSPP
jgi:cytochrome c biogenesis protein CcmG/thiol:disulfide interchange protein DsbE